VPGPAAERGPDPLSAQRRFALLRLDVEIRADPALRPVVEFLAHGAEPPFAASTTALYEAFGTGGDWTVARDGRPRRRAPGPAAAIEALYAVVNADALVLWPTSPLLRGALGTLEGRRLLVIGERGAGVTCLAVRLLFDGAQIEGDAFALLAEDGPIAVPRRFALRTGARVLLPEVAELVDGLPWLPDGADGRISGFDPAEAGFPWALRQGPIDLCVAVEPNHGGRSRIFAEPRYEMVRRLMARSTPPAAGGSSWIAAVSRLVDAADCWCMQLGDLDEAIAALRSVL
jgi:hypothetical protein